MGVRSLRLFIVVGAVLAALLALSSPADAQTSPPAGYAGSEACKGCHEEAFTKFGATKMGRLFLKHARNSRESLGCESCHGPGKAHVDAGGGKGAGGMITFAKNDKTPVEKRNAMCLACHTKGARLFWESGAHAARDVACTSCHTVMTDVSPKSQLAKTTELETCGSCHVQKKAQALSRTSHMPLREGKMTCSSCHNPHGTPNPALLKEIGPQEACYTCHTEKRGPFLWTHPPVQENCSNCHDPHGSNHENMLKVAKPRLCQQCHQSGHPASPRSRATGDLKFVLGRSCTNCHSLVHGSNHPAGVGFTR